MLGVEDRDDERDEEKEQDAALAIVENATTINTDDPAQCAAFVAEIRALNLNDGAKFWKLINTKLPSVLGRKGLGLTKVRVLSFLRAKNKLHSDIKGKPNLS